MTGYTDFAAFAQLESFISNYPYIGLLTAVGLGDGPTGFVEVSGGSYTRVSSGSGDWSIDSDSPPRTMHNIFDIEFPVASLDWGTILAVGFWDAPTSGNMGQWDYLGNYPWRPCTISSASPCVFTTDTHNYSVSDNVIYTDEYGGTRPTFSQASLTGTLVISSAAPNTFSVTNSGLAVNTSSIGSGMVRKLSTVVISNTNRFVIPANSLTMELA